MAVCKKCFASIAYGETLCRKCWVASFQTPGAVRTDHDPGSQAPPGQVEEVPETGDDPTVIRCPFCSEEILSTAKKCKHCNEWLVDDPPQSTSQRSTARPRKSRSAAIVLALFLGGIGAHKFYLDRPGAGLLYLLFCWTLIPAIVALVEAFHYLSLSNDAFQKKYDAQAL